MSLVGSGDIASILPKRDDLLFFASGVSNSQETRESEYQRELSLLLGQSRDRHLVYFSSLATLDGTTRYHRHKREMERTVQKEFSLHTIIRIGNITWGSNPNTLINYLRAHPDAEIKDEYRYIVDESELLYWINLIPKWPCQINVPGRRMKVQEVVDAYVTSSVDR